MSRRRGNCGDMHAPGTKVSAVAIEKYYAEMDKLPKPIRDLINSAPYPLSVFDFKNMLAEGKSVESVLAYVEKRLTEIVKHEVRTLYGPTHPQAD